MKLSADEETQIARIDEAESLRETLGNLSRSALREGVDALSSDDASLVAAREEAMSLARGLGRAEELEYARELAEIGAHEAGEPPIGFADEDRLINDSDLYRRMRLADRAQDHALAIVTADRLSRATADVLRLPRSLLEGPCAAGTAMLSADSD